MVSLTAAASMIDDDLLDEIAVVGEKHHIDRFRKAGLSLPILYPVGKVDEYFLHNLYDGEK